MTAKDLFDLALGIIGISSNNAGTYSETALPMINTILMQTHNLENHVRRFHGLLPLTTIPTVVALTDVILYQERVLRNVAVYGLAQLLVLSDDDVIRANFFGNLYSQGFSNENKFITEDIIDVYGGDTIYD